MYVSENYFKGGEPAEDSVWEQGDLACTAQDALHEELPTPFCALPNLPSLIWYISEM